MALEDDLLIEVPLNMQTPIRCHLLTRKPQQVIRQFCAATFRKRRTRSINILKIVFRREGSKLPLYGGVQSWGCNFFPPKLTFL